MKIIFALSLVAYALSFEVRTQKPNAIMGNNNNFDFLLLVANWGQTVCDESRNPCSMPSDITDFTIHGLWPSRNDTSWPSFCTNAQFDMSAISSIKDQLDIYWHSFGNTDESFWSHEYTKHGTCASVLTPLATELDFFTVTLNLYKKYLGNVKEMLAAGNVVPSSSQGYSRTEITGAIKTALGVDPVVFCSSHDSSHTNYLEAVALCLDNDSLTPFQCDQRVYQANYKQCSGDTIMYPPPGQ